MCTTFQITVDPVGLARAEGNETFSVTFTVTGALGGGATSAFGRSIVTIKDDGAEGEPLLHVYVHKVYACTCMYEGYNYLWVYCALNLIKMGLAHVLQYSVICEKLKIFPTKLQNFMLKNTYSSIILIYYYYYYYYYY